MVNLTIASGTEINLDRQYDVEEGKERKGESGL